MKFFLLFLLFVFISVLIYKNRSFFQCKVDYGFLFPCFLGLTLPIVYYLQGFVLAYFYLMVLSLAHLILLQFYPYLKNSDIYRYYFLRNNFYLQNLKVQPIYSPQISLYSKIVFCVLFYFMYATPEIFLYLFPFGLVSALIVISDMGVDFINILYRPRLPKNIYQYHTLLQRRWSPYTDIILNKIIPACGIILFKGGALYGAYSMGYKAMHSMLDIDPIRNATLNFYYKFPSSYTWTETSLGAWSTFTKSEAYKRLGHEAAVEVFIIKQQIALNKYGELIASTDSLDSSFLDSFKKDK